MTDRRWLWVLIAVSTACRLAFSFSIGPCNDESYGALFAVHLDWSYYDHPPMMAIVARLGMLLSGGRYSIGAMRTGFVVLAAGSTWMMARLTGRLFSERAGLIAAFLLNATPYYGVAAGCFILPDGPLLFFWLLTLDRMATALETPGRVVPWLGLGLAWGATLLSKYHAVFLPVGALVYMVIEPTARRRLREPGVYLAFALGLLIFSPVIYWNANHHWASFAFQAGRAQPGKGFRPDALAWAIVGPSFYLLPWIWLALWAAVFRAGRKAYREGSAPDRFLLAQIAVPMAVFLAVSSRKMTLPHWSLIGLVPAFPLLSRDWSAISASMTRRRVLVFGAMPIVGMVLFAFEAHSGLLQRASNRLGWFSKSINPTGDMYGWDQVADELRQRGLLERPGEFFFTSQWFHSGHLAFALGGRMPVLCYNTRSAHNFEFWEDTAEWVGHTGMLVVINETSTEPAMYDRWFEKIEPLAEFLIKRAGETVRKVRVFRCINQLRPFPELPKREHPNTSRQTSLPRGWSSPLEWSRRDDLCREIPSSSLRENVYLDRCPRSSAFTRFYSDAPLNISSPKRPSSRSATAASSRSSRRHATRTTRFAASRTASVWNWSGSDLTMR